MKELDPPQFIKGSDQEYQTKNGTYVSDFDKQNIKSKLKSYAIAGINSEIIDLKVIYVNSILQFIMILQRLQIPQI